MTSSTYSSPSSLSSGRYYFSRRDTNNIPQLPVGVDFRGIYSPWAMFWGCVFVTVPLAYIYILAVVYCELCVVFPDTLFRPLEQSLPKFASWIVAFHDRRAWFVEMWCIVEALFYIGLKIKIHYLNSIDPLAASFRAAPILELEERAALFQRVMETEMRDPVNFLTGWFFDAKLDNISRFDIMEFISWSMFEYRHQEHLTPEELDQLEEFVDDAEIRLSLHLYGTDDSDKDPEDTDDTRIDLGMKKSRWLKPLPRPRKMFRFQESTQSEEQDFFSTIFESYRQKYEEMMKTGPFESYRQRYEELMKNAPFESYRQRYQDMLKNAPFETYRQHYEEMMKNAPEFHPVQEFRNLMAETAQQLVEAEESAMSTANQMYESLVPSGSPMGKKLSKMSHATYNQLTEAWNSVKSMKESMEIAKVFSSKRKRLEQQLKGLRVMLTRLRAMASAVPHDQMAALMRRITECNESMETLEGLARSSFLEATGIALQSLPFLHRKEPQRFAKYSSDPLLGLATYPLGFHLLVLGLTEIPLRVMMSMRGFERLRIGSVAYYYHPGRKPDTEDEMDTKTPLVFVHGIGIGLIAYMPLIDALLKTGRPLFMPELPFVSGFRPWQSPSSVLTPAGVASTMTGMLAMHGFLKATWMGHSWGTSWLSFLVKLAPDIMASIVFMDPICFNMHISYLTKQFVYMKPDPGTISYMVRTDVMVNWTVQRATPWAWISLFVDQVHVPCAIFLSDKDALVPAANVEDYLRRNDIPVEDFDRVDVDYFSQDNKICCAVFRGDGHGGWTERPSATIPMISAAVERICSRAE